MVEFVELRADVEVEKDLNILVLIFFTNNLMTPKKKFREKSIQSSPATFASNLKKVDNPKSYERLLCCELEVN